MNIEFGALAPSIAAQLRKQRIRYIDPTHSGEQEQADADAIIRLAVRGILSPSEVRIAHNRLIKQIAIRCEKEPTI